MSYLVSWFVSKRDRDNFIASVKPRYEIRAEGGLFVLVSITPTLFGKEATNFVASGTKDYCDEILRRLTSET